MERYELGKLVQLAGTLRTRKRMQKVVYLLQAAGCPLKTRFYLHHYGPYSSEIAGLTDILVHQGLLSEQPQGNMAGRQFNYVLTAESDASIRSYEETSGGQSSLANLKPFEGLAKELLQHDLQELEYASTIAYFKNQGLSWDEAFEKGCAFKQIQMQSPVAQQSLGLARRVVR